MTEFKLPHIQRSFRSATSWAQEDGHVETKSSSSSASPKTISPPPHRASDYTSASTTFSEADCKAFWEWARREDQQRQAELAEAAQLRMLEKHQQQTRRLALKKHARFMYDKESKLYKELWAEGIITVQFPSGKGSKTVGASLQTVTRKLTIVEREEYFELQTKAQTPKFYLDADHRRRRLSRLLKKCFISPPRLSEDRLSYTGIQIEFVSSICVLSPYGPFGPTSVWKSIDNIHMDDKLKLVSMIVTSASIRHPPSVAAAAAVATTSHPIVPST